MVKTNSQIENARFAMQFLRNDIVHAGFWDSYVPDFDNLSLLGSPGDYPALIPDPCKDYASWDDDYVNALLGIPVQVYSGVPGTCGIIVDKLANTDVLVVRHANTCEPGVGFCDDTGTPAGQLYFQTANCEDEVDERYSLDPNSPLMDRTCTPGVLAPRRKFVQSIYYIRDWANENSPKDGIPTLVRSQFGGSLAQQTAVALVEGIERFRIEVGIDSMSEPYTGFPNGTPSDPNEIAWLDPDLWETAKNRGDGIPDIYQHCPTTACSVGQLANVVAVKLYVLARANEATAGYVDTKSYKLGSAAAVPASGLAAGVGFKRHVFSTTVRLNNISGRRETP
jgi:type IV pilus assembly protein PilW